jgi:hypothetical protein
MSEQKNTANNETTLADDLAFIERYQAQLDLFRELYKQLFVLVGQEIEVLSALSADECGNA